VAKAIESRVDPTGGDVAAQVAQELNGKSGRWNRIRAVCRFVQESITYLEIVEDHDSLAGFRPHSPASVLHNRYGDCKDKATLLVSALRSVGEAARVLLVNHGSPLRVRADWPTADFNHAIVVIKADGSEAEAWPKVATADGGHWILFDPTDQDTPLGVLPPGDGGGWGLVVAERAGELVRLPVADPQANGASLSVHLTLGKNGTAQARIAEDFRGTAATSSHHDRRTRTGEQYGELLEDVVHRTNPLSRDLHWKDDWDEGTARLRVSIDFVIPDFGHRMPNGLLRVSPALLSSDFRPGAWTENADGTVFFPCDSVDEEVVLDLPEGYVVDELPDSVKRNGARFSGEVAFSSQGAQIVMKKNLTREPGYYDRAQYNELRNFYREIHEAERASALLRPSAAKS
jgi:hypothetical protein